jgi:hypothetical protein
MAVDGARALIADYNDCLTTDHKMLDAALENFPSV